MRRRKQPWICQFLPQKNRRSAHLAFPPVFLDFDLNNQGDTIYLSAPRILGFSPATSGKIISFLRRKFF